jgi:hypothetical protein
LGDARLLVNAACMLNPHPGWKPVAGGADAFLHVLTLLGPDDRTRPIALAGLACVAPQCFEIERTDALISEAVALARSSGSRTALHVALDCQLYLEGGPARLEHSRAIEDELAGFAQEDSKRFPILRAVLAIHRTLVALQRGDVAAMATALEHATARCREVRHGELLWHCERFAAIAQINAGSWTNGVASLETLHRRAEQRFIFGTEPFCAFDRAVTLGELTDTAELDGAARSSLGYDASEPPSVWALKVRALATAGLSSDARVALRAVTAANLAKLPCDRDYLGTLGHLARAALLLNALDYAEAIYPLLLPHPQYFASQVSFLCEGSVSQLLGMLAHALGRRADAVAHLEVGISANERAGLAPRAAEARLQLAQCLLDQGTANARPRALELAREAHSRATQLGMQRLVRAAAAVLQSAATA